MINYTNSFLKLPIRKLNKKKFVSELFLHTLVTILGKISLVAVAPIYSPGSSAHKPPSMEWHMERRFIELIMRDQFSIKIPLSMCMADFYFSSLSVNFCHHPLRSHKVQYIFSIREFQITFIARLT